MDLLHIDRVEKLKGSHYKWAEAALNRSDHPHVGKWTESIGMGSKDFLKIIKKKLGRTARGQNFIPSGGRHDAVVCRQTIASPFQ